jgi:hypothetical protein
LEVEREGVLVVAEMSVAGDEAVPRERAVPTGARGQEVDEDVVAYARRPREARRWSDRSLNI